MWLATLAVTVKKYGRQIVAIVVAIYTGGATLAAGWSVWASGAAKNPSLKLPPDTWLIAPWDNPWAIALL
jgi:erythromycin esterase-like protein